MRRVSCGLVVLAAIAGAEAVEATDRQVVWRIDLAGWGEPAVDDGAAYVLTRAHQVVALDLATGVERWRVDTGGAGETPLGSAVKRTGSSLIVADDAVIALDPRTGATRWRFAPDQGSGAGVFLGDADDHTVVTGSFTGSVFALDARTGALRWTRRVAAAPSTTVLQPALVDGGVVAAYTTFGSVLKGGLVAFDGSGRRRWSMAFGSAVGAAGSPRVWDRVAIVARTDGVVEGVDVRSGRSVWRLPAASTSTPRDIRPVTVAGGAIVIGSLSGALVAFDLDSRRQRWRVDTADGAVALRLVSSGDTVYVPLSNGTLTAVTVADGRERWRAGGDGDPVAWPPGVGDGVIVAVGERSVLALRPSPRGAGNGAETR